MFGSILGLYPLDDSSKPLPNYDNQKCLQMWPDIPCGAKLPPLRTNDNQNFPRGDQDEKGGDFKMGGCRSGFEIPKPICREVINQEGWWDMVNKRERTSSCQLLPGGNVVQLLPNLETLSKKPEILSFM